MTGRTKLNLAISNEQKYAIKLEALKRGMNVNDIMMQAFENYIKESGELALSLVSEHRKAK